jgi:hypothetical protein
MTNRDDLKVVWICDDCKIGLIFHDDVEDHCKDTGHNHLTAYNIGTGKKLEAKKVNYGYQGCI